MKFNTIGKSIISAALLAVSVGALAEQVPCPSATTVASSWQMIDTVSVMSPTKFAVWGMNYIKDSGYNWMMVTYSSAKDMNTAFTDGQNNIKNTFAPKQQNAIDMGEAFLCGYNTSTEPLGVALIAYKDDSQPVRFGSINFKLLNAH